MKKIYLVPIIIGAVIILQVPIFNHIMIDQMNCVALKNNIDIPVEEKWGEAFYSYMPHLEQEYAERCS